MKKISKHKPLKLTVETLRTLPTEQLANVAGAGISQGCFPTTTDVKPGVH